MHGRLRATLVDVTEPRRCPFCGSTGPLTKEDAWPRWLNQALTAPAGPGTAHDITLDGNKVVRVLKRTATGYNTARVPGICAACNNGWMSRLEQAAAPLLLPMINGETVTLDRRQQAVVTAWVTKTGLVFDQRAKDRDRFVSPEVTRAFGADPTIVSGSRVVLARYSERDWHHNHSVGAVSTEYRNGRVKTVVAIVTLCVRELVMQLVCPTDFEEDAGLLVRDGGEFAVQIEPVVAAIVRWPPRVSLDSAQWFEFGLSSGSGVDVGNMLDQFKPPARD